MLDSCKTFKSELTLEEQFCLFRALDVSENGVVGFDDMEKFFLDNKKPMSNYSFFVINLARQLEAQKKETESFMSANNFKVDTREISESEFGTKTSKVFPMLSEEERKKLFRIMQEELRIKNSNLSGTDVVKYINQLRGDKKDELPIVSETTEYTSTKSLKPASTMMKQSTVQRL